MQWNWSRIVRSCIFHPCIFGPAFSGPAFSYPGNLEPSFFSRVGRSLLYLVHHWSRIFRSFIFSRPLHELQPKRKMIDELELRSRFGDHLGRAATRTHQQGGDKLDTWLLAWPPAVSASNIYSTSIHLQICILTLSQNGSFQSHPHTTKKQRIKR